MKTILFAFTTLFFSYQAVAQIEYNPKNKIAVPGFIPVTQKLKQLPANSPAKKMTQSSGATVLSPMKMKSVDEIFLSFIESDRVDIYHAVFHENQNKIPNPELGPHMEITFDTKKTGVYLFEINAGVRFAGGEEEFSVYYLGTIQTIKLYGGGDKNSFTPQKIIFAFNITTPSTSIYIKSKNGSWDFKNCEITLMK